MNRLIKILTLFIQLFTIYLLSFPIPSFSQIGRFDHLLKSIIYKQGDEQYLILHESFYQAKSESYTQGNIRSSGYNSSRISVYNLKNGKIIVQKDMGIMDSTESCLVLGCTSEDLWIFSKKYKSGLQSLNPVTLEKKVSQATIYSKLKQNIGLFPDPYWQEMNQYYGFDPVQQKLIITNERQQKYYLDLEIFTAEKITENINLKYQWDHYLRSSAILNDSLWKLEGFDKMVFVSNSIKTNKPEFLNGLFIMEQNPKKLFLHYIDLQDDISNQLNGFSKGKLSEKDLERKTKLELALENAKINTSSILKGVKPDDVLLQPTPGTFFIWSKNKDGNESVVRISKITSPTFGNFTANWETSIPGMFYNVSTARYSREFKVFFGDFIPESNSVKFELIGQQLIVMYLNQVCSLNIITGIIDWAFIIK